VIGHHHQGERIRARVVGFQRLVVPWYEFPFVVHRSDAVTEGVLIMDLSPEDLAMLDAYEEVDQGVYRRVSTQVSCLGCGPTEMLAAAQIYVAGPALEARLGVASGPSVGA